MEPLHKIKKERDVNKQELKRLKEKKVKLKIKIHGYQMRERILMWGYLLCLSIIVVPVGVRGGR